jgi:hypothetical protein
VSPRSNRWPSVTGLRSRSLRSSAPPGVVVLGMHRSGTSAATRLVNLLGPATCDVDDMVRGPWNPKGHFESRSLMHLNNRILAEMGRRWWYPPPDGEEYFSVTAAVTIKPAEARKEFRRVHRSVPWVWKDPRTCVLLPFWRQVLGDNVAAMIVFRNPMDVAISLERRHDLPLSFGVALWERYNRLLLAHAGAMPTLTTRYDDIVTDPVEWVRGLHSFLSGLGMEVGPVPADDLKDHVDPGLRHSSHTSSDVDLTDGARAVYDALEASVGTSGHFVPPVLAPEDPSVTEELDRVGPRNKPLWRPPPWQSPSGEPEDLQP